MRMFRSLRPLWLGGILPLIIAALAGACTEVTEKPEDCISGEYYENESQLCRTCAPIEYGECPSDCGFELVRNEDGCQEAECSCSTCDEGMFFDRDTFECVACPDYEEPVCEGQVVATVDARGCAQQVCDAPQPGFCGDEPTLLSVEGQVVCECETNQYVPEDSNQCTVCAAEDTHEGCESSE